MRFSISSVKTKIGVLVLALTLAGCGYSPVRTADRQGPEKLIVYADGNMEFRDRPIHEQDVIIYEDGYGGEKAAVRIRMEPLHPDFFRDTIVVERRDGTETGQSVIQN